jgi:hypothetical protein
VELLEARVNKVEKGLSAAGVNYDPLSDTDVTVVATGIPNDPGTVENLDAKVDKILQVLGCDVTVVACKRLNGREGKPGIVKISFESLDQKLRVLRAKQKLRQHRTLHGIYLRSSQTHAERLVKLNFEKLLNEFPDCNLKMTSNGRLVYPDDPYVYSSGRGNSAAGPPTRGRGSGRSSYGGRSRGRGYARGNTRSNFDMFNDFFDNDRSSSDVDSQQTVPKVSSLAEFPPISVQPPQNTGP